MSEVVHLVPVVLRFHKHVKCPAVAEMLLREYYGINLRVIALWRDVAHRKQLILLFCCDGLHISSVFNDARNVLCKCKHSVRHVFVNYLRVLFISLIIIFFNSLSWASMSFTASLSP